MTRMSTLADALKTMANASRKGKRQVLLRPTSKVLIKFLTVMQKHGYISDFELVDDHRGGKIIVELNGRLNKCGVVSPRYNMALIDIDEFTTYLLPSRQFGFVVMTTSLGIMVCLGKREGGLTHCRFKTFFLFLGWYFLAFKTTCHMLLIIVFG